MSSEEGPKVKVSWFEGLRQLGAAGHSRNSGAVRTVPHTLPLLGRVALGAQRPIVVRLSRRRSVGPYVRACVGLSRALWKNGGSDPDAVWHHRSDGSRDEADSAVWGSVHENGYIWGDFGAHHYNQWGLYGVRLRQRRDAALFPNYFGQTCCNIFCVSRSILIT